jgi:dihydroflavonol-4-reductase
MPLVLIIGGTGFLGYHTTLQFVREGWEVTALGLSTSPPEDLFPSTVKLILQDLDTTNNKLLLKLLCGHDAVVYSAGLDDRFTPKKPAFTKFNHNNVELTQRILEAARQVGIKHAVVFGSYFAHFHRQRPEMRLVHRHPYIRSRLEQETALTSINGMDVKILELPYVFGAYPGGKPIWCPLVKYIRSSPLIFYPHGGTACVSVGTVASAAYHALEKGQVNSCYPIGQENLTWSQMLSRLAFSEKRVIKIVTIPSWMIRISLHGLFLLHKFHGKESGLNMRFLDRLQTIETFIDPLPSLEALGYRTGNLDQAFQETMAAC